MKLSERNQQVAAIGQARPAYLTLKQQLATLGFLENSANRIFNEVFDYDTMYALFEFKLYNYFPNVAKVKAVVAPGDYYSQTLEPVQNDFWQLNLPMTFEPDDASLDAVGKWIDKKYRCPIVMEAYETDKLHQQKLGARPVSSFENVWKRDALAGKSAAGQPIAIFVMDFTDGTQPTPVNLGYSTVYHPNKKNRNIARTGPARIGQTGLSKASVTRNGEPFDDSSFRIIGAVAKREVNGLLDAANAWDIAIQSLGPFQWALGSWELSAYLAYLSEKGVTSISFFHLGFFGILPKYALPLVPDGTGKFTKEVRIAGFQIHSEDKYKDNTPHDMFHGLRDYLQNWHWFYRFVQLVTTNPDFPHYIYEYAKLRIDTVLGAAWDMRSVFGQNFPIYKFNDIFRSETSIALLIGWHVHLPGQVLTSPRKRPDDRRTARNLKNAFAHAAKALPTLKNSPTTWGQPEEDALVAMLKNAYLKSPLRATLNLDALLSYTGEYFDNLPLSSNRKPF